WRSRSFPTAGARAQARHGSPEPWQERLDRIGLDQINLASLTINYRTPVEVMAEAEPVIRAVLADANVPTSIRSTGVPVEHGPASDLGSIPSACPASHVSRIEPRSEAGPCSTGTPKGSPASSAIPRFRRRPASGR